MNASKSFAVLILSQLFAPAVFAANNVDPSEVNIKVYETRISPNANCIGGFTRIFQSASPTAQDFLSNPSIGSGAVPNGTFRCVALRISDFIRYKPSVTTDNGSCVAGTPLTQDIIRGETNVSPDGESVSTAVGEDIVWIYLSTTGLESNSCLAPSAACLLGAPLSVQGDRVGTFVADFRNQVQDQGSSCSLEAPTFSFR